MGRTKNLKRRHRDDEDEDVSSGAEVTKSSKNTNKTKKAKTSEPANSGKDDNGNSWWSLGGTRRIAISDFKGKTYINIREYYTDASGDLKPGKKGIMLTLEQYNGLLENIPAINAELQAKGHETPDITSGAAATAESPKKAASKDKRAKNKKANIEATSEEDDEDEQEESD